jgi:hypothetical protein
VGTLYKSCAVANDRWKLEYYLEDGVGRLFDRVNDPDEQHDLYADPNYAEVRQAMLHALLTWRGDLTDMQWLQEHTTGGGPVAVRAAAYTHTLRGSDSERRLNERVERLSA